MTADKTTVTEILIAAREAVDAAELPVKLQAVAFEKAVDLLAGAAPSAGPATPGALSTPPAAGQPKTIEAVAAKLGLAEGIVGEVFHIEGDELRIGLARSKFKSNKSGATKQLALLISAGRQAGGWDDQWTPTSTIRQVVNEFGRLDGANFATTVRELEDIFSFSGSRQDLKVKVRKDGYDEAAALVRALTGQAAGGDAT